jgi:hypothetical protein
MAEFSDFIVFADESGDHGLMSIDAQFPVFALTLCVMKKADYASTVVSAVQALKFKYWGHDAVVFHEHDIRKSKGYFAVLMTNRVMRESFLSELNDLVQATPMTIFSSVIDKIRLREKYANPWNPYEVALHFCLERLHIMMINQAQQGKTVHVVFESRGSKEDGELELEFRRIVSNNSQWGYRRHNFSEFDFQPVFVPKAANSPGLQLADLTARPIALSYLRPDQSNRAFEIIQPKLGGRKTFP